MRSFDVFQERMRLGSFERLRAARESGRLNGLAYVHLKQDLEEPPLDWKDCEDPSRPGDQLPASTILNPLTGYGVLKTHQTLLAAIRTDLDVFSDIESAALMASGYLAMDAAVPRLLLDVPMLNAPRRQPGWFFSPMLPMLGTRNEILALHLAAGSKQAFRLMQLDESVRKRVYGLAAAIAAILAILAVWTWSTRISFTIGNVLIAVVALLVATILRSRAGKWSWIEFLVNPRGALRSRTIRWVSASAISIAARKLVPMLTKKYLDAGKLERLH